METFICKRDGFVNRECLAPCDCHTKPLLPKPMTSEVRAMNEADAKRALDLYQEIRAVDGKLVHVHAAHTFAVNVWATVASGNYPFEIKLRREDDHALAVRAAVTASLHAARNNLVRDLRELGFDAPSSPRTN